MKAIFKKLLVGNANIDLALLALRIMAAIALIKAHGLPKLLNIQEAIAHLPDPFGMGAVFSTYYAIFTNVFCAIFVAFGFLTRVSALFIISITLTGLLVVLLTDPAKLQDTPLIYSIVFGFIAYVGAGKYSLDYNLFDKN